MKKTTKVMLITGASIIAVGVVFTTVGLVRGSSTSVGTAENYEKKVYDFSDDINNIKNTLDVGDSLSFTIWREGKTLEIEVKLMDLNDVYGG